MFQVHRWCRRLMIPFAMVFVTFAGCGNKTSENGENIDTDSGTDSDTDMDGDTDTDTDSDADADTDTDTNLYTCDSPHPSWILCEDFEAGGGDFEAWRSASEFVDGVGLDDRGRITLSSEEVHSGNFAVYLPADSGSGCQGASLDWRACEGAFETNCRMRSFDTLYFRIWVRFAEDHRYVHHFLNIGGSQPDDFWYHGTAGCLPNGALSMGTTVDFEEETHESFFYTYTPDMSCDTNCGNYADVAAYCADCAEKGLPTCDEQEQCCWGNLYGPTVPHEFDVGRWFCFEMMMRANTPGEHDGQMAYWVDDALVHQEDAMMWRTSPTLALNRIRIQHYITESDAGGHSNRVWFDDAVVSTEPIGCGN
jgi:hypothetical protein